MKVTNVLLFLTFTLAPALCAQTAQSPAGTQTRAEHRHEMMHKQQMEAMEADVEKMKSSLAQMKANISTIKDMNELARWKNNVDLWETMVGHMEQMQKHMESMGPGVMGPGPGPGMGGTPPSQQALVINRGVRDREFFTASVCEMRAQIIRPQHKCEHASPKAEV
jgi:hypothetical protein